MTGAVSVERVNSRWWIMRVFQLYVLLCNCRLAMDLGNECTIKTVVYDLGWHRQRDHGQNKSNNHETSFVILA